MSAARDPSGKIKSDSLRHAAELETAGRQVVLVELASPAEPARIVRGPAEAGWQRFDFQSYGDPAPKDDEVLLTREAIEKITGSEPLNFFRSSASFVVEADGEELKRIAELPSVKAIWPNSR